MFDFFTPQQWWMIGGALTLALGIYLEWDKKVIAAVKWATTPKEQPLDSTTLPGQPADPDIADMLAFKRLTARFNRLECPEAIAAMQTVGQHFFHEKGHA